MLGLPRTRPARGGEAGTGGEAVLAYAAAPFAPNSFARLRLVRQLHACGLLSGARAVPGTGIDRTAPACLELADDSAGASC